jgi:carboxylesterase type B
MNPIILYHAKLGSLKCLHDTTTSLTKVLGLPYGTISQRFARSQLCSKVQDHPSSHARYKDNVFDATSPGPSSIQPFGSVKSDASNIPLPTDDMPSDEEQSEDCLNLSIHLPPAAFHNRGEELNTDAKLPVLVFIHGGAYFLGSANRPYYSPVKFMQHACRTDQPVIFVAINYRLGALGFWHAQTEKELVSENNGLHDQILALQWIKKNIGGFGGDASNITTLGQSAGGESLSILSNSIVVKKEKLFKRAIMLSGTPVTMPAMTPNEHTENFLAQAKKLDISIKTPDGKERSTDDIAFDVISAPLDKIRDLAWVGSPCTQTNLLPFDKPSMAMMRNGGPDAWLQNKKLPGIEAQIVSTTTYDGGISYNMMSRDPSRSSHAAAFRHIATDVLGPQSGAELCRIYGLEEGMDDPEALTRICLFESDIGFFCAALSVARAHLVPKTYFQIFDLPNPFNGPLSSQGKFATHTFDIATLMGGYDESLLPGDYVEVIADWRTKILAFVRDGSALCGVYSDEDGDGKALIVGREGVREIHGGEYMRGRRQELVDLAGTIDGDKGWDVLWVDVCRRFLMKGS